jgi:diguanylate cyclase (GGDEF)-like protein/PAS domain S-box-containing protein
MWVYDLETLAILDVNEAAVRHYGYPRDVFVSMTVSDLRAPEEGPVGLVELDPDSSPRPVVRRRRHLLRDGRAIDVDVTTHPLEFAGRAAALVLATDITTQRQLDEQLRHQAFHDGLTGLANRALFRDRVEHAVLQRKRSGGDCAVLLLDLDDFKVINDTTGHKAGDQLLAEVADRLRACMRPDDTAARLGGDEFGVLLEHVGGIRDAVKVTERILGALRRPITLGQQVWLMTASVGIASAGFSGGDADEILRNADVAMYSAKSTGKGRFGIYEPTMHAAVLERLELENDLRTGIATDQLRLHYQPEVDINTGTVVGVEALVRWQHPSRGLVPPNEFILVAEDAGLIEGVDAWVLRTALLQLREWVDGGLAPIRMAVNVSGRELNGGELGERVRRTLEEVGTDPGLLEIEVTEHSTVETTNALEILEDLRGIGVRVAIDDFGIGYSMLSRLNDFPLDKLKLDQSFIRKLAMGEAEAPIVSGMIAMGHSLGMEVLAEGVETEEQLAFLRRAGCDLAQGFYFSRAVEPSELTGLLRRARSTATG